MSFMGDCNIKTKINLQKKCHLNSYDMTAVNRIVKIAKVVN